MPEAWEILTWRGRAATDEPVVEVRIVGNKLVPTPQILNEMQTRVGRPYDPVMVQRDVRKLATRVLQQSTTRRSRSRAKNVVI